MQLAHARIQNFRSLRDVSVAFDSHTALIGANGVGKSSILKAIEVFYSAKGLQTDDYFGRDTSLTVIIEMKFGNLTPQEQAAFSSRVRGNLLVVTRIFDSSPNSGRYFGTVPQNMDFRRIRSQATASAKLAAYRSLRSENQTYHGELPSVTSAQAADDAMATWEAAHPGSLVMEPDDGQFFGFQNASRGALKRYTSFVFIPAVREASLDAADGKSTAIGQLLEILVRSAILQRQDIVDFKNEMSTRYQELVSPARMPELGDLAGRLTADLRALYRDAEVGLTWREVAEFPVPLPVADVSLHDDGFGGPVDRQGHGLQRAFVLTLLQYLAKTTAQSTISALREVDGEQPNQPPQAPNLILAIEEPELYQHPTKQRHFTSVLRGLSNGTLPGTEGATQVIYGSHSPMFVSMDRSHEIRLIRRKDCEDSEYKQCELRSLDLENISADLEMAWQKPAGTYSAPSLVPRLHILGTELAEGFFAHGVVLVEGRSDKAMLYASARLIGLDFEAAGFAVLSAEGKGNLDKPFAIFRALGIPTYIVWDCDAGKKDSGANLALLRLLRPDENLQAAESSTYVGERYAHFESTLEKTMKVELTPEVHSACLTHACDPFGLMPNEDNHKIPQVMYATLLEAQRRGSACVTLDALVRAIWLHLGGGPI